MEWKISQARCSGYSEAITTKKETLYRRDKETCVKCTGIIRKKLYELIHFLQSYDVN